MLILFATWALAFVDSMAMNFRRVYDTGKSGWIWVLLLIPIVHLLPLYWLLIEDSQQSPNKYGPPVKRFYEAGAATACQAEQRAAAFGPPPAAYIRSPGNRLACFTQSAN